MATLGQDIPDIEITVPEEVADSIEVVEFDDGIEVGNYPTYDQFLVMRAEEQSMSSHALHWVCVWPRSR